MNNDKCKMINKIYGTVTALLAIAVSIALIISCVKIYNSGEQPYSREAVAESFSKISILVYAFVAVAIGGFFIAWFFPAENPKSTKVSTAFTYKHIRKRAEKFTSDTESLYVINRERRLRRLHSYALSAVTVVCAVLFLSYALNINNFPREGNMDAMIKAMAVLAPCALLPFAYALFASFVFDKSMQREIELLRSVIKVGIAKAGDTNVESPSFGAKFSAFIKAREKTVVCVARYCVFGIAVLILVLGIIDGGFEDVLTKAKNICTECIGLG